MKSSVCHCFHQVPQTVIPLSVSSIILQFMDDKIFLSTGTFPSSFRRTVFRVFIIFYTNNLRCTFVALKCYILICPILIISHKFLLKSSQCFLFFPFLLFCLCLCSIFFIYNFNDAHSLFLLLVSPLLNTHPYQTQLYFCAACMYQYHKKRYFCII